MAQRFEVPVSPALRQTVEGLGSEGATWLRQLPTVMAEVEEAWRLDMGAPLEHGGVASVIVPVATEDGRPAILKLSVPHPEARHEADGLSLDVERVLRWAVVKAIGWNFGRDKTLALVEAADPS